MIDVVIRAVTPLVLLMVLGYLSKHLNLLKKQDSKTLSSYVYYFALPALFLINIAETRFTKETIEFIAAAITPLLLITAAYILLSQLKAIKKQNIHLMILSTVFGSAAFFGIPFITFTYPTPQGEKLVVLAAAAISAVGVSITITVLELAKTKEPNLNKSLSKVGNKFSRNPLILSIIAGLILSLSGIKTPDYLSTTPHMLGKTTSTIAIFMLGLVLYGRSYSSIKQAGLLSLLRILLLPAIAYIIYAHLFSLPSMEKQVLILMHAMPVAISLMVLSERYRFEQETISTLLLISSTTTIIYLPLWLIILGSG